MPGKKHTYEEKQDWLRLFNDGISVEAIATHVGVWDSTVRRAAAYLRRS